MKNLILLFLCLPTAIYSQFGFERSYDIEVYKNSVQQKFPWVGGLDYCNYSNIDLNLDGVLDLYIFDRSGHKSLTFIQNGTNGQIDFEYAPQYESAFPKMYGWVLLVDYDGDGKKDIFTASGLGADVYKNISTNPNQAEFEVAQIGMATFYEYNGSVIPTYVFVSQSDLPAIVDIDNDGDIDILSFHNTNNCIRYHKNMSQEIQGNSDTLTFKTVNVCYGNMAESNVSNLIVVDSCCTLAGGPQVDNPEGEGGEEEPRPGGNIEDRHPGSSLLSLDLDADGLQELVIGDIAYNGLTRMLNDAIAPNTNIDLVAPDYAFPSYDTPVNLPIFPAAYYVDVNNDGIRDLIAAPNSYVNSQNYRGNWLYINNNLDDNPDFEFQTEAFLQGDMIDGGSISYPVYFDHNGDGLKDLIVSISDRYDSVSTEGYSQLLYYENQGTATNAEFHLVSEDYLNFSNFNGINHSFYRPAFGDVDGDGDEDLLMSDLNDTMYYFENAAGAGNIAQFINPEPFKNNLGDIIYKGIQVSPKFVDLDRDGKDDLVIGKRNGTLTYYRNISVGNTYSFEFVTDNLGGVNVSEFWTTEGIATPEFVDIDNEWHLICGSVNGFIHYYDQIDGNLAANFNLRDSALQQINIGAYSSVAVLDIDGDNKLEMLIGNERGGLSFFRSDIVTNIGLPEQIALSDISVYPNPAKNQFFINLSKLQMDSYDSVTYNLLDVSGKSVVRGLINQSKTVINTSNLTSGLYFISINIDGQLVTNKIVIE